jgi:hypothetical protein
MTAISETPGEIPVAYGRLRLRLNRPHRDNLRIDITCPHCQQPHTHGFKPEPEHLLTQHRTAHCPDPRPAEARSGYYIGLDPQHEKHHRRLLARLGVELPHQAER